MKFYDFIRQLFLFPTKTDREIKIRIITRNENDVIITEKYVPIRSVYNPLKGPIGINIELTDVESAVWESV